VFHIYPTGVHPGENMINIGSRQECFTSTLQECNQVKIEKGLNIGSRQEWSGTASDRQECKPGLLVQR